MKNRSERGYVDWAFVALGLGALVVLGLIVAAIGYEIACYHHKQTLTCTVTSKDRTSDGHGNSDARIYTDRCGVLQVTDATWIGHFSSADTYSHIQAGRTYVFHTIGYRVPFLSDFPNIVTAEATR